MPCPAGEPDSEPERLARAEGLLEDVRSALESIQGQKAIIDQAGEKAGSLRVLIKQSEAMIEGLREERDVSTNVREAISIVRDESEPVESVKNKEAEAA